jgi:hypothetical protein
MSHSETNVPKSTEKGQPQCDVDEDIHSIRELTLDDLDNGFLETLDNLLPDTSKLDRHNARDLLVEIRSNPLHRVFCSRIDSKKGW